MAKAQVSKSYLLQQRNQLALHQRLLPSLDLKRRQLTIELARAERERDRHAREMRRIEDDVARELPMLDGTDVPVAGLVKLERVVFEVENVMGVKLPRLGAVELHRAQYGLLTKPAWVDVLVAQLQEGTLVRLRLKVAQRRVELLAHAVRRMTQRVNLFEKILIPNTRENIRLTLIALGDRERSAVVRSKLAKARHAHGA